MVKIQEAIVVEGRYDRNTLSQIVDAPIFETSGFGIMKNPQQLALLRNVAKVRGLIVFTDADGGGLVIRNYLKSAIDSRYLKHAYIPDIPGKERRKKTPGKEGKLGVEGMRPELILEALRRAGATMDETVSARREPEITKQDMMALGLSGSSGSSLLRKRLAKKLDFPENISANALLQALNLLLDLDQLRSLVAELENTDD